MKVRWRAGFKCECCSTWLGVRGGDVVRRVSDGSLGSAGETADTPPAAVLLCGSAGLGTGCAGLVGAGDARMGEDVDGSWFHVGRGPRYVPARRAGGDGAALHVRLSGSGPQS
jgi:hypothetical protein